ncbi:MAG: hypothetical protein J6A59_16090 [Lachnospiraceae bacterium]|nr:hypothetical protein [Lachnospiraceae bacterium]
MAVGISLYARDFTPAGSSQEFSGQWWRYFSYMPGFFLTPAVLRKFLGSGGKFFSICPKQEYIAKGWHSRRYL